VLTVSGDPMDISLFRDGPAIDRKRLTDTARHTVRDRLFTICPILYRRPSHIPIRFGMATLSLATFIDANRDELIGRCRAKVAKRLSPAPREAEIDQGVPLFLSQLSTELSSGPSKTHEISVGAIEHGRALLARGFSLGEVVHDYGDVCQSITDLAVEKKAPIDVEDFRTLNRCLDDAIAGAVTEFAREQDANREGELSELWSLVNSANVAFEALRSGTVGVGGATGVVLGRTLASLRAYVDRREIDASRTAVAPEGVPERRTSQT
jgi:hypothetical protein